MADFPRHEYQGCATCRQCHRTIRAEWRVQDHRGHRIGKYAERYACHCYEQPGELLEAKETLDRPETTP